MHQTVFRVNKTVISLYCCNFIWFLACLLEALRIFRNFFFPFFLDFDHVFSFIGFHLSRTLSLCLGTLLREGLLNGEISLLNLSCACQSQLCCSFSRSQQVLRNGLWGLVTAQRREPSSELLLARVTGNGSHARALKSEINTEVHFGFELLGTMSLLKG